MFFELTGNRGAHSNDGKCSLRERGDLGPSLFRQRGISEWKMTIFICSLNSSNTAPPTFCQFIRFLNFTFKVGCVHSVHLCVCVCVQYTHTCMCRYVCLLDMEARRGLKISCSTTHYLTLLRCDLSLNLELGRQAAGCNKNIGVTGIHSYTRMLCECYSLELKSSCLCS